MNAIRPHEGIINNNVASLRIYNTMNARIIHVIDPGQDKGQGVRYGNRIIARLTLGSVDYEGQGKTVAEALDALDEDLATGARDCDCVLPGNQCSTCCPKEVTTDIFF